MNIRKFMSLGFVSVASLFWASCDSDSNPQTPDNSQDPESSADTAKSSASTEPESSAAEPESSAEASPSSSEESAPSSSSDVAASSSSNAGQLKLAKDPSITCTEFQFLEQSCPSSSEPSYTCLELQDFLKKDTTVSEKILNKWEEMLESCGAIRAMEAQPVYGIIYPVCPQYVATYIKCSDGMTYRPYANEDGVAYLTKEEYYETHSSSSVAESSSSSEEPEDLVANCPQDSFALFTDILKEVQADIYEKIAWFIDSDTSLPESWRTYYESILDRENRTLKGRFAPYLADGDYDPADKGGALKYESEFWFSGYIPKTQACADGEPEMTESYKKLFERIEDECSERIETNFQTKN